MSHPKQGTGPHDRKQEIGTEKRSRTTSNPETAATNKPAKQYTGGIGRARLSDSTHGSVAESQTISKIRETERGRKLFLTG